MEKENKMEMIKKQFLTPSQARELVSLGFVLKLVKYTSGERDEYEIYALRGK